MRERSSRSWRKPRNRNECLTADYHNLMIILIPRVRQNVVISEHGAPTIASAGRSQYRPCDMSRVHHMRGGPKRGRTDEMALGWMALAGGRMNAKTTTTTQRSAVTTIIVALMKEATVASLGVITPIGLPKKCSGDYRRRSGRHFLLPPLNTGSHEHGLLCACCWRLLARKIWQPCQNLMELHDR